MWWMSTRTTPFGTPLTGRGGRFAPRTVVRSFVVATFSSVTRQHVLQAIAEYDARGGEEFLEVYGFGPSGDYPLVHDGLGYDSRAVLGVAHRFATGRLATAEEVSSDMEGAVAILRKRGFEVTEPTGPQRPTPVRSPRAPRATSAAATRTVRPKSEAARAAAARDTPPPICPTCLMTLPATGRCDDCG